jgi:hypothetical protein
MRTLNILSGVAVLLTTFAYAHLLHHFFLHADRGSHHNPVFWVAFIAAVGVGVLSFIGGCLLLKGNR